MKEWFNRMKPKLKNYRWWILLAPSLVAILLLFVINSASKGLKFAGYLIDFNNCLTPRPIKAIFDWCDSNDKH